MTMGIELANLNQQLVEFRHGNPVVKIKPHISRCEIGGKKVAKIGSVLENKGFTTLISISKLSTKKTDHDDNSN